MNLSEDNEVVYGYYGSDEEKVIRTFGDVGLRHPPSRREVFDKILDDLSDSQGSWDYENMPAQIAEKLYYAVGRNSSIPKPTERGLFREIMDDLDEMMDKNPPTPQEKIAQDRAFNMAWAKANSEAFFKREEQRQEAEKRELERKAKAAEAERRKWQQEQEYEERMRQPAVRVTQHRAFFFTILLVHDPYWHKGRTLPVFTSKLSKEQVDRLPKYRKAFAFTRKGAERRSVRMMWRYCKKIELKQFRKDRASRPVFELVRGEAV